MIGFQLASIDRPQRTILDTTKKSREPPFLILEEKITGETNSEKKDLEQKIWEKRVNYEIKKQKLDNKGMLCGIVH